MNNLPLEKQVCTLEQSEELAKLLGKHAPESLWVWVKINAYGSWGIVTYEEFITNPILHWNSNCIAAYTDDELGALLPYGNAWNAHKRADALILDIKQGRINPEDVKYA
jgi:hypothetical protein